MRVRCSPSFVVDTSALMAVLNDDPDADGVFAALAGADAIYISSANLFEARYVVKHVSLIDGVERLGALLAELAPEMIDFDEQQLKIARSAYAVFGSAAGHPAALNIGDCFAYALAKTRKLPLLFKGDDFVHTDIEPALKMA